jgi:alkylation response protein AidB-like acyl-CoA dehydrogenase
MDFEFSEEQSALADSIGRFLAARYDFEQRKAIVRSDAGMSDEVWRQLAEMGVLAIPLAEDVGGFGGGAVDLMGTMRALGAALVIEPVLATLLAARLVDRTADAATRAALLGPVVAGASRLAFAHTEDGARYRRDVVATTATRDGDGWVLDGLKRVVVGAPQADRFVVSATTPAGGLSLFAVPARAAGVAMTVYRQFDEQRAADLRFDHVRLAADALLGTEGQALPVIDEALDFATALLCAEGVGAMQYANDTTVEYLKTRRQFGVPIGSFQALQHRMVEMVIATEQARSMSCLACSRVDGEGDPVERARCVSAAKIKLADAARLVAQETVQLHGGIGMTDELKASHTFRRLTMIAQQHGDADFHLERFAALDA